MFFVVVYKTQSNTDAPNLYIHITTSYNEQTPGPTVLNKTVTLTLEGSGLFGSGTNCVNNVFTAAKQEKPVLSITLSSASEPNHSPHTPPSPPPQLLDTRKSVLRDDSETSRSFESVMEGKALTGARDSG